MTPEEIKLLKKIPIKELKHYIDIRNEKSYYVKNQMYEKASELRDNERKFVDDLYDKFKVDYSILFSIDISILRELLIDEIVN